MSIVIQLLIGQAISALSWMIQNPRMANIVIAGSMVAVAWWLV